MRRRSLLRLMFGTASRSKGTPPGTGSTVERAGNFRDPKASFRCLERGILFRAVGSFPARCNRHTVSFLCIWKRDRRVWNWKKPALALGLREHINSPGFAIHKNSMIAGPVRTGWKSPGLPSDILGAACSLFTSCTKNVYCGLWVCCLPCYYE